MTQITEISQAIAKEITVDFQGHGFITGRGLARLLGVSQPLFTDKQMPSKIREILTGYGFEPDNIAQNGFPDLLLPSIAFYYAVDARKTSSQARQVLKVLGAIGARTWMQQVKGWKKEEEQPVAPPVSPLPPADVRVINLVGALKDLGFELDNPRFNQELKDLTGDILGLTPVHSLQPATSRWCGVVERAEHLGYPVGIVTRKRVALGKYVKKHYQGEVRQEKRLCNGTHREINLYEIGDRLDRLIMAYLGSSAPCAIDETSIR